MEGNFKHQKKGPWTFERYANSVIIASRKVNNHNNKEMEELIKKYSTKDLRIYVDLSDSMAINKRQRWYLEFYLKCDPRLPFTEQITELEKRLIEVERMF